jgi:hypothetical protein
MSVLIVDHEDFDLLLRQFFKKTRSEDVRSSAKTIIDYLIKKREEDPGAGWVRSRDLFNALVETNEIPYGTQFWRILEQLNDLKIIEKEVRSELAYGKKRPPVFYRIPLTYPGAWFSSKEELIKELTDSILEQKNIDIKLVAAIHLLKECHINNPLYDPKLAIDEWLKNNEMDASLEVDKKCKYIFKLIYCGYNPPAMGEP